MPAIESTYSPACLRNQTVCRIFHAIGDAEACRLSPPSLDDLASSLSLARSTVHEALRNLKGNGLIERQPKPSTGGRPSKGYRLANEHTVWEIHNSIDTDTFDVSDFIAVYE